ncbi:hypothetical protein EX30DRAFT_218025 [Ascodesmis nigricans]|uniref:Tetraspanin Tsp3 n=1 Tax=Ascodesmis nigricans TaxID=341454 RepID=A0A4S2MZW3_9PEZI|nr:hypothetical protein EX30DRAFT_218025 [Ascodesmis nigricans]
MPQTITTSPGALPGPRPRRSSSHLHTRFQSSPRSPPWIWKSVISLFIINAILLILAAYGWSRLRHLSLPFSTVLPLITTLLPIFNFLSLSHGIVLSRGQLQKLQTFRTYLYILIFLIFDTIITVVSFTHLANYGNVATCTLGEQWQGFWAGKEEGKVKRIQDSLGCCGFRTVKDRAWPWGKGVDTGECSRLTGRDTPCVGVWRGEEKMVAGLFVGVGVVLGVVKPTHY